MPEPLKVVIRYADGRVVKGQTNDFFPNKPSFHLHPAEIRPSDKGAEIAVRELKAVFFVRDFTGNPSYNEHKSFEGQQATGKKVEVSFNDGEVLVGTTLGYDPTRAGFFIIPADPQSNNLRVFIVCAAMKKLRYI